MDELYANLAGRNAEIYVQRARRLRETRPPRTALFRWQMERVDVLALADPSLHGFDNISRQVATFFLESFCGHLLTLWSTWSVLPSFYLVCFKVYSAMGPVPSLQD